MPVIMFRMVDLPLPDGPTMAVNSPRCKGQVNAAQRHVLPVAHRISLDHVYQPAYRRSFGNVALCGLGNFAVGSEAVFMLSLYPVR